ncbi:hypothetical protein HZZ13_08730 [Bradyrhizobium sp. CNPSo 4010]|uniref:Peptidase M48 domain-containing protein n=1 Tax=Bradyrhizobium agreste TaxID=2751811 RepID=A0ABS0PL15_9BRAD|nr:hypothetical protein [Bradyrhizobium agreste]MBH5397876.1 hypothetical protein [Bradyrhizobium agreste]
MLGRFSLGLLFCFLICAQAPAQDAAYQDHLASNTRKLVTNLRPLLRPTLQAFEASILDDIDFRIVPDLIYQGLARRIGGKRVVIIYSGIPFMMEVLSNSMFVGLQGKRECYERHLKSSLETFVYNSDPNHQANKRPVFHPAAYANFELSCAGAEQIFANMDARQRQVVADFIQTSIAAVILHEIAHHVLGHVDNPPGPGMSPAALERSRQDEDAADRWAIRKLLEMKMSLLPTIPYLLMTAALTDYTLEAERASTHPLGARRALGLLDNIAVEVNKIDPDSPVVGQVKDFRKVLNNITSPQN